MDQLPQSADFELLKNPYTPQDKVSGFTIMELLKTGVFCFDQSGELTYANPEATTKLAPINVSTVLEISPYGALRFDNNTIPLLDALRTAVLGEQAATVTSVNQRMNPATHVFLALSQSSIQVLQAIITKHLDSTYIAEITDIISNADLSKSMLSALNDEIYRNEYNLILETSFQLIEIRDKNTAEHCRRVSENAALFANYLGFDDSFVQLIKDAGLIHDLGKIGFTDEILIGNKRLSEDDRPVLVLHVIYIVKSLSNYNNPLIEKLKYIVYFHHTWFDDEGVIPEKFDSDGIRTTTKKFRGYPLVKFDDEIRALKGHETPFGGRLLTLVDVFDAVTEGRPYSQRLTVNQALEIIYENAGKQFDPHIAVRYIEFIIANYQLDGSSPGKMSEASLIDENMAKVWMRKVKLLNEKIQSAIKASEWPESDLDECIRNGQNYNPHLVQKDNIFNINN